VNPQVLVVIPARWASSRFPGKLLEDLGGRPLVVRTAEAAARMRTADEVVVATDDERISDAVVAGGFACELTGACATGTDRVGLVAARRGGEIVVNLQGDEPLLDPADADALVTALRADPQAGLATCAHPFGPADDWADPNVVKVLVDRAGRALYFSRSGVPGVFPGPRAGVPAPREVALRHIGIYAYRRDALARFLTLPPSPLETVEGLEQLRALENGMTIRVVTVARGPVGVDTPADLARVRAMWADQG
jgi:3-deoxy-manno-octulosonate cytidylyltransferase (CMP-KDO synthetase)